MNFTPSCNNRFTVILLNSAKLESSIILAISSLTSKDIFGLEGIIPFSSSMLYLGESTFLVLMKVFAWAKT